MKSEGPPPTQVDAKDRLPVAEVSNEVIWINPEIRAPFDMKEGESTKLGVFVSNVEQRRSIGTVERHGRTGIFGAVIFEDAQGRRYRDVDGKGLGNIGYDVSDSGNWLDAGTPRAKSFHDVALLAQAGPGEFGLMDRSVALKDASMAEEFLARGIRTYRVIGVTKLKELIVQTESGEEKISVDEAKQRGFVADNVEPVVEVRAFGTRARLQDIENDNGADLLTDAQKLVQKETGVSPEKFTLKDYLEWFAKSLGESLGRMHKAGFTHGYLTRHNLTLDCRIIDLDSIEFQSEKPNIRTLIYIDRGEYKGTTQDTYMKDVEEAANALGDFSRDIGNTTGSLPITSPRFKSIFEEAYFDTLRSKDSVSPASQIETPY